MALSAARLAVACPRAAWRTLPAATTPLETATASRTWKGRGATGARQDISTSTLRMSLVAHPASAMDTRQSVSSVEGTVEVNKFFILDRA